ncbi:hypothetical protein GUJ93_ZPchr0002g23532 [Zizania palustris]|uniref:HMA domain-containing protein n=1 Tax=Zizania palustris TaxID=103762 RepID=A0A8J5S0B9_ZIZPA|nr:hypothetical protein GUJ93_ZPchr0002g23532 [Zizania palustris]
MAKKKRSGGGQQQKPAADVATPAEEHEDQGAASDDTASGDVQAHKAVEKERKALPPVAIAVLKVDMHCDGCAHRIRASVRRYPGVEGVAMEVDKGTMTVVGRFDAKKLRDRVANKTKKKVDLLANSSSSKKGGGDNNNNKGNEGDGKPDKEEDDDKSKEQASHKGKDHKPAAAAAAAAGGGNGGGGKGKGGDKDHKKPLVPVVGTVVLKIGAVGLHCDGCMDRIRTKLFNIKGVEQVSMDMAKNQVNVTGTMDIKALPEKLRKKLRRPVDVVPPNNKQQQQQVQKQDGNKQHQDGKEGKDGKDAAAKALTAEKEAWKSAFYDQQTLLATEFMLSDENPNACSIS